MFSIDVIIKTVTIIIIFFRIVDLSPEVPITFIYGSKSWIDSSSGTEVQNVRRNAYVDVQV